MNTVDAIEESLQQLNRLSKNLRKSSTTQVKSAIDKQFIRATAFAWFKSHKDILKALESSATFRAIDTAYDELLQCSDKETSRTRYFALAKQLKKNLIGLRSDALQHDMQGSPPSSSYPNFNRLISDPKMLSILQRRWNETQICLQHSAPLAATVMMGALLEALLLGRVNALADKASLFKLTSTPKKNDKALPLQEWKLKDLIDISAEMKWIREPAKKVSVIIRDYRNFIHPERELSSGINIEQADMDMFWAIFVQLAQQIIASMP